MNLIVVDNFHEDPDEVRRHALSREYIVKGNYPGLRSYSYATQSLRDKIQEYVRPFGGDITHFSMEMEDYNGSYQYTTCTDRSWIHQDETTNWAGVLYLTPDAPLTSGTAFYESKDKTASFTEAQSWGQDMTKWNLVDQVANKYNRLILFNSKRWHMSMNYFGKSIHDGRLIQVFFFCTN
jgi:hypothetical protein